MLEFICSLYKMSSPFVAMKDTVTQAVTNKKFLIVLTVTGIFIAVAFWVYNTYVAPKLNPEFDANKEFIQPSDGDGDGDAKEAVVYMFYTDWCPHCQAALKDGSGWKQSVEKYNGQKVNGVTVTFLELNGEKNEATMKEFEKNHDVTVEGFPSIYLVKGNSIIEFESDTTFENLNRFLNTTL